MSARHLGLVLLLPLAGCATPNVEQTWTLAPRGLLRTSGGHQLELDEAGNLIARPAQEDVEANVGARLSAGPDGVQVGEPLRADAPLQRGDLIQWAHPLRPQGVAPVASSHAVRSPDDLRGYALRRGARIVLGVIRGGERLTVPLDLPAGEPVGLQLWAPSQTRPHGFTVCRIAHLPAHLRPPQANVRRGDFLVTEVVDASPFALRGLRPLDVIPGPVMQVYPSPPADDGRPAPPTLLGTEREVLGADGVVRAIDFSVPDAPDDWDLPFLLDVKVEPHEATVSIGPFGVLGEYKRRTVVVGPTTHAWSRWHVLNLVGSKTETHAEREIGSELQVGVVGIPPFWNW